MRIVKCQLLVLFVFGLSFYGVSNSLGRDATSSAALAPGEVQAQISNLESKHLEEIEKLRQANKTKRNILISALGIVIIALIIILVLYRKRKNRSKEFENLNNLKDMIFQVISHDLRSPLYSFRSLLKMAENKYIEKDEYEEYLKNIQHELRGITSATESLLRWAQVNQKGLNINKQKVKVRETCQNIKEIFKYDLEERGINLKSNFSNDLYIYTDKDLFSFILRNLIQNAIKFSYDKGNIEATATEIKKSIVFEIVDHGKGMNSDQIENINAKISSPEQDVRGFKSSGLGMIICKDFAERLNIELSVSSTPNKGTAFRLEMPKPH